MMRETRRRIFRILAVLTIALMMLIPSPTQADADIINYNGTTPALQDAPAPAGDRRANTLFVGTMSNPIPSGNTVTVEYVTGGSNVDPRRVFGGIHTTALVTGNTVYMKNGYIWNRIYGGYACDQNSATGNIIVMTGGNVVDRIAGAHSINGSVSGNKVTMSGGVALYVSGGSIGGSLNTAYASGNQIEINGGQVGTDAGNVDNGWVFGGVSDAGGTISQNKVTLNAGGKVNQLEGGESKSGQVLDNIVEVKGGTVLGEGGIRGGWTDTGTVKGNKIFVSGGTVNHGIDGGFSRSSGKVEGNHVEISGGQVGFITGGAASAATSTGDVTGNSVVIKGNPTVKGLVRGGWGRVGKVTGNSVSISGGTFDYITVYAGAGDSATNTGYVKDNVVNISGTPVLDQVVLWGTTLDSWRDDGNTLNVNGFLGSIKGLAYFQKYNFKLSSTTGNNKTILTVTEGGGSGLNSAMVIAGTTVTVGFSESLSALAQGDKVVLIDSSAKGLTGNPANVGDVITATAGNKTYKFSLSVSDGKLVATVDSVTTANSGGDTGDGSPLSNVTTPSNLSITIGSEKINAEKQDDGTYLITVPNGTDISKLTISGTLPTGAKSEPKLPATHNFNDGPLEITVTAQDGKTTKMYTIKVTVGEPEAPTERALFGDNAADCEVVITGNAVTVYIPFIAGADPKQLDTVRMIANLFDLTNVAYAYVGENGDATPVTPLMASPSVTVPYLKISGTAASLDTIKDGAITKIEYRLKGDDTTYVQTFPNGGLKIASMPGYPAPAESPSTGGGSSGGCDAGLLSGAGLALLALAGCALAGRRRS